MAATELLSDLVGINPRNLTSLEKFILEVELFTCIYEELKEIYKAKNKDYFFLIKSTAKKEEDMLEAKVLCFVVNDILSTEEYSLEGIANYTQIPEDVVCDVILGKNQTPSLALAQKIIDLHRSVKPELYREVIKKIIDKYFSVE